MEHSLYNPNLVTDKDFLFSFVKNKLQDFCFILAEEEFDVFKNEDWRKCFQEYLSRMQKSVNYGGEDL